MKVQNVLRSAFGAFLCAFALAAAPAARAQLVFDVTLDTTPLVGHAAGDFKLFFTLLDNDLLSSNSVQIDNFSFGTGAGALGTPNYMGGASGDLSASVLLTETAPMNDFFQAFSVGDLLSFRVTMTTNYSGGLADTFSFGFLDNGDSPLPMMSFYTPYGADAAMIVEINGQTPVLDAYGSDPTTPPFAGGDAIDFSAPVAAVVPPPVGAVPEPSTYGLFAALALFGAAAVRRKLAK